MKTIISTAEAPQAIGPYSQAVKVGDLLFVSGQIALDPQTGALIGTDPGSQLRRAMESLGAILRAADLEFRHVVKTTIYLKDMDDFAEVNGIYSEFFDGQPPARATVEVSRLPKDVLVEVDAVASAQA